MVLDKNNSVLDGLNPQQREAASHLKGPILVLAGAGSGKTRVLTHRVANLVSQGIDPGSILAITFTNKAANEMKSRVRELLGPHGRAVWVSTFHALCARMLRTDGESIGVERSFVIYDSHDQTQAVKMAIAEMSLDDKRYSAGSVLGAISDAKNELLGPAVLLARAAGHYDENVALVYERYQSILKRNNALDFDDLLMQTVRLLQRDEQVRERYQNRFEYILVDEYQDTNRAQYVLVNLLAEKHRNLFAVGDDDQNIYTFRGASLRNILEFESDFPEASIVRLEQNYRSTQSILDASYHVIKNNTNRVSKRLWTENGTGSLPVLRRAQDEYGEGTYIVDEIQKMCSEDGMTHADFAVLYRTHAQSRVVEECFLQKRVPYVIVGGLRFYERKEIKDTLAYLRLVSGASDFLSLRRIINTPRRGIGDVTLGRLEEFANAHDFSVFEALSRADQIPGMASQARGRLVAFNSLLTRLMEAASGESVYNTMQIVLEQSGYLASISADTSPESLARAENIKEFLSVALEFDKTETGGLDIFLEGVSLLSDIDTVDDRKNAVTLMTLHSAKGLEFPVVFLLGMEEGLFPHARSMSDPLQMEEERRLCYVGMTRARSKLYITHADSRTIYGRTDRAVVSRFIGEIPKEMLDDQSEQTVGSARTSWSQNVTRATRGRFVVPEWTGDSDFAPGDRVAHPKLGPGTVVSVKGSGPEAQISVAFPEQGVKTLISRYANMRKE